MKQEIKETALKMINESGLINLSRAGLCERVRIPVGSFAYYAGCTFTDFVKGLKDDSNNHQVFKTRVNPILRRENILIAAVELARENGYNKITRDDIAERAGVSMGLVTHYFETMVQLRRAVMRHAIQFEIVEIIAQGLANKDDHARKAPEELKKQAVDKLLGQ